MFVLFKNGTISFPVHALNPLELNRSINQSSSPFFLLPTNQPLTRKAFIGNLRQLLLRIGIQLSPYSGHSLRVGAATSVAAAGVPDHLIQVLGCWTF
jgi:site-specific recombinase XerD